MLPLAWPILLPTSSSSNTLRWAARCSDLAEGCGSRPHSRCCPPKEGSSSLCCSWGRLWRGLPSTLCGCIPFVQWGWWCLLLMRFCKTCNRSRGCTCCQRQVLCCIAAVLIIFTDVPSCTIPTSNCCCSSPWLMHCPGIVLSWERTDMVILQVVHSTSGIPRRHECQNQAQPRRCDLCSCRAVGSLALLSRFAG